MEPKVLTFVLFAMRNASGILLFTGFLLLAYHLILHPLNTFPGPLSARISSAQSAFYIWRRDFHVYALGLHKKYGPVVRVAPNRLLFSSATSIQEIYNSPIVTKGRAYLQLQQDVHGTPSLLSARDKDLHRQKRQVIAPVVSDRSMRIFEPEMLAQIDVFSTRLLGSSQKSRAVNMSPRCERLGVDIVGKLAFGYALNTQVEDTHRDVVSGIKARGARVSLYYFWARIRRFEGVIKRIRGGAKHIDGLYNSLQIMIKARMELSREAKHDFYKMAIKDKEHVEGLISNDLWVEAVFFIAAGGSTVATAMSGIFFYLSRNPDAYAQLSSEVRSTFSSGEDIKQGPLLSNCKYLRAVIDETMRMSPSTLAVAWREQEPSSIAAGEKFVVDGHVIPPGTQVALSNYTLQHNPTYFPEPFSFRPKRWLPAKSGEIEAAKEKATRTAMRKAFAPFSVGDRSCAGKPMAYLEMSLVVAKVMWYFDFERAPGEEGRLGGGTIERTKGRRKVNEFQLYEGVVVGHEGPNLVFTPRGNYWKEFAGDF